MAGWLEKWRGKYGVFCWWVTLRTEEYVEKKDAWGVGDADFGGEAGDQREKWRNQRWEGVDSRGLLQRKAQNDMGNT